MYYYWLLGQGYKKTEKILKHQLKMVSQFIIFFFIENYLHCYRIYKFIYSKIILRCGYGV
jgi:hypothetical protein